MAYRPRLPLWKHLRSVRSSRLGKLVSGSSCGVSGSPYVQETSAPVEKSRHLRERQGEAPARSHGDVSPPGCRHTKLTKLETRRRRTTNRQTFVSLVSLEGLASAPKTPAFPSTTMAADTFVVNVRTLPDALESEMRAPHQVPAEDERNPRPGVSTPFGAPPPKPSGAPGRNASKVRDARANVLVPHSLAIPNVNASQSALSTSSSSRVCSAASSRVAARNAKHENRPLPLTRRLALLAFRDARVRSQTLRRGGSEGIVLEPTLRNARGVRRSTVRCPFGSTFGRTTP